MALRYPSCQFILCDEQKKEGVEALLAAAKENDGTVFVLERNIKVSC